MWRRRQRANRSTADDQERQQRRQEHELDRPARQHARAEVDVAGGSRRELGTRVEPAQELLRRAPELGQPHAVEPLRLVGERARRPLAAGRQRQRRNALRQQRPLLVQREREAEVDELRKRARVLRAPARLLEHALGRGLDESRRGEARLVADQHQPRAAVGRRARRGRPRPRCAPGGSRRSAARRGRRTRRRRWRRRRACAAG